MSNFIQLKDIAVTVPVYTMPGEFTEEHFRGGRVQNCILTKDGRVRKLRRRDKKGKVQFILRAVALVEKDKVSILC